MIKRITKSGPILIKAGRIMFGKTLIEQNLEKKSARPSHIIDQYLEKSGKVSFNKSEERKRFIQTQQKSKSINLPIKQSNFIQQKLDEKLEIKPEEFEQYPNKFFFMNDIKNKKI